MPATLWNCGVAKRLVNLLTQGYHSATNSGLTEGLGFRALNITVRYGGVVIEEAYLQQGWSDKVFLRVLCRDLPEDTLPGGSWTLIVTSRTP